MRKSHADNITDADSRFPWPVRRDRARSREKEEKNARRSLCSDHAGGAGQKKVARAYCSLYFLRPNIKAFVTVSDDSARAMAA